MSPELQQKYEQLAQDFATKPDETFVYVPFQDTPNLPGFKINTTEFDGRTLYHGLASQSGQKLQCIPTFTSLDEVQPSYAKHFELILMPVSSIVELISKDSSAQGLMIDMFSANVFLDQEWVKIIKENSKSNK